jgi:O-antigen/teichoic acid export membrane protein
VSNLDHHNPAAVGLRLRSAVRAHWSVPLHRSTYLMTANLLVTLVSGVGFWMLAARLLSPAQIGAASAFVAPSTFLSIVFLLGANYGVLRFAREIEADHRLLFSAIWCSAVASAAGGALAAWLLLRLGVISPIAGSQPLSLLLYMLLVAAGTVWTVCESAFVGLRAPWQMLARNVGFALIRIVVLFPCAALGELGLVGSFAAGTGLAALLSLGLLRRHLRAPWPIFFTLRHAGLIEIVRFALPNHMLNLITNVPGMMLPLIALHLLGAEVNGFFAVAWTVTAILRSVLTAASATLLAEGARDEGVVGVRLARSIGFLLVVVAASALPMVLVPWLVLIPFGAAYAAANSVALRLFALSILPAVPTTVFVARERIRRRVRSISVLAIAQCVLSTALPYLGARLGGYVGFAFWYMVAQWALGVAVLPALAQPLAQGGSYWRLLKRLGGSRA